MKKFVFLALVAVVVASGNPAYAHSSWLEGLFGSKSSEQDKEKAKEAAKNGKEKVKKEKANKSAKRKGPPDHAKAHGYRAKFKHYPDSNVYENTETGRFYGKKGGTWKILENIPSTIDLGNGVTVDLEAAIPNAIRSIEE
jgi:hypothetical protein